MAWGDCVIHGLILATIKLPTSFNFEVSIFTRYDDESRYKMWKENGVVWSHSRSPEIALFDTA